jgi:predicted RND superfamily exporter protein
MWGKFASIILRNRLYILAIIALLTVFFGYFAFTSLKVDNRVGNTLPKDSPVQQDFEKFKLEFGEDGSTIVVAIQTDSLYTKRNFTKWRELSYKILKYDGVENVISEATLWGLKNNLKEQKFDPYQIFGDPKTAFQEKSIDITLSTEGCCIMIQPTFRCCS